MNSYEESSPDSEPLFDIENVSDSEKADGENLWDTSTLWVELKKGDDGFGLTLEGGTDRPLYKEDEGIFIIRIKKGSNADKLEQLEAGDKVLEVNGKSLHNLTHGEAIEIFKNSREKVRLVIHKNIGQILGPPSNFSSDRNSGLESPADPRELKGFSPVGFVFGIAVGCVVVFAARRYWLQR